MTFDPSSSSAGHFAGEGRGGDLRAHDRWMRTRFDKAHTWSMSFESLDCGTGFATFRESPPTHRAMGPHPGNVLVRDGRLAGVLDTGGFGAADPALDLVAAWHLLDLAFDLSRRTRV